MDKFLFILKIKYNFHHHIEEIVYGHIFDNNMPRLPPSINEEFIGSEITHVQALNICSLVNFEKPVPLRQQLGPYYSLFYLHHEIVLYSRQSGDYLIEKGGRSQKITVRKHGCIKIHAPTYVCTRSLHFFPLVAQSHPTFTYKIHILYKIKNKNI